MAPLLPVRTSKPRSPRSPLAYPARAPIPHAAPIEAIPLPAGWRYACRTKATAGWEAPMKLRLAALFVTLALGILVAPLATDAQQPAKVPRIGFLVLARASDPLASRVTEAFRQGLRERGYVEGQNIAIEYRWAEGRLDRFPGLAADLVRLKVDVIIMEIGRASCRERV